MSKLLMMPKEEECVSSAAAWPFYTHPGRHPFGQAEAWRFGDVRIEPSTALGATSTLLGQQPFRQVVPRGFGDAGTNPSPSLSCKRRGHAPLITRPGLHHQPSWTHPLTHPARRVSVSPLSWSTTSLLSYPPRSPSSWPPSREWEGPCVSSFLLSLVPWLSRRLSRNWTEWVRPHQTANPSSVLVHPAVAGVVDGIASDCLPT